MIVHLGGDWVVWARDVVAVVGVKASRGRTMRKLLMSMRERGMLTTIGDETNSYVFTAPQGRQTHVYACGLSPHSFARRLAKPLAEDGMYKS